MCIGQTNIAERYEQVTKMIKIYQTAKIVIIWFREESHDSSLAIQCIRHHGAGVDKFYTSPVEIEAVEKLFRRSYWYRA